MIEFAENLRVPRDSDRLTRESQQILNIMLKKKCANFPVFVNTSFKLIIESKDVYILLNIGKIRILKILVQNIFFLVIKPTRESQILTNIQKWSFILLRPPGKTIAKIIFRNGIVKILIFPTLRSI